MASPQIRPTTKISDVILDSMDSMFAQLIGRLDGLTDEEYRWEPVDGSWSVRLGDDGVVRVDGAGDRTADPAPVTTIAWRLWHIAIDCFDDYTRRFAGDQSDASPEWTTSSAEAVDLLRVKWSVFRSELVGRDLWDQLGPNWAHFSRHAVADIAMHASNEMVHHGAEIALLRDLYRASFGRR